jgi:hypothetical protein
MIVKIALMLLVVGLMGVQGTAWADIETSKVTPITVFSGNQTGSSYTFTIYHSQGAVPQACLALISYNTLLSTTFAFNTSIVVLNTTVLQFTVSTYNTTYFNILSYHYLITLHPTLAITRLCYYTSPLYTGNGTRNASFFNASTTLSGTFLTTLSALTGFRMYNTQGEYFQIKLETSVLANTSIQTTITTSDYNMVEWVCLAVVVYNPRSTLPGEFYLRQSSVANYTAGLLNLMGLVANYEIPNAMFYGLS